MDRTERFYKIDKLLNEYRSVSMQQFIENLEVSQATIKRDLEYMKDRLNAPIVWDRLLRGYRFSDGVGNSKKYNLPGLWFNDQEALALLTMHQLLSNLGGEYLRPHIEPLMTRLYSLLGSRDDSADEICKRIRILNMSARSERPEYFEMLASATVRRKRLKLSYHARSSDLTTERMVSPQRIVHYRDNWYLDGWCHLRNGLRCFSLDAISSVELLELKAKSISEKALNEALSTGYGIFSGKATRKAVLRFTPAQARWVAAEQWHPEQLGKFESNGSYLLEIPFSNDRELLMDILKYGADVEVVSPKNLREKVKSLLSEAVALY